MSWEQAVNPEISKEQFVRLTSECYNTLFSYASPKDQTPAHTPLQWEEVNSLAADNLIEHAVGRYLTVQLDDRRRLTIYKELTEVSDTPWHVNLYEPAEGDAEAALVHTRINISRTNGMTLQGYTLTGSEEHTGVADTDYARVIEALNEAVESGIENHHDFFVRYEQNLVGAHAIHEAFSQTSYGERLASKIRYEKYNLGNLANEEWVNLLGADVNCLKHMHLTYGLARSFIRTNEELQPGTFSPFEQELLRIAAIIHDQGESIVGDISYSDRTDEDTTEEHRQFTQHTESFFLDASPEMKHLITKARDEIVFNETTKLGQAFNAIERCGYARTALRAAEQVQHQPDDTVSEGLRWLVTDVLANHMKKLTEYADELVAVDVYLQAAQDKISDAFLLADSNIFEKYGDNQFKKEAEFKEAYDAWQQWRQSLG